MTDITSLRLKRGNDQLSSTTPLALASMKKGLLIFATLLLLSFNAIGQFSGPTNPSPGIDITYTFNNGTTYVFSNWVVVNGTIMSSSSSGTSYSAIVRWTAAGSGSLSFRNKATVIGTLNVSVCAGPAAPVSNFTYTSGCGIHGTPVATITRTSSPPGGVTWYWQTSPDGITTAYGSGSSVNAQPGEVYYLRAYSTCWGGSIAAAGIPYAPFGSGATGCAGTSVQLNANTTVRWYDACSGGNLVFTGQTFTTPQLSATTYYYATNFNASTGVESPRTQVIATITPATTAPSSAVSTPSTLCGPGTVSLSASGAAGSEVYRWYSSASGGTPYGSTTQSVGGSTTFYVSKYNASTGCEGPRIPVSITVNTLPSSPTVSSTAICGTGTMSATTGANGNTTRWYNASSGGSLLTTGSTSPTTSSTVTYYVTSYNTTTSCESTTRIPTTLTINPIPAAPVASSSAVCATGALTATTGSDGNTVRWYNASSGGSLLATSLSSPTTTSTTTYYLSSFNTSSGCESTAARIAATLTVNPSPLAPTSTSAAVCGPGTMSATVGANGNTIRWYETSTATIPAATSTTSPTTYSTQTYFLTSYNTTTGCESRHGRVETTLTINPIPDVPEAYSTALCGTGTMTAISGSNGNTVRWYSAATGGSPLTTSLTSPSTSTSTTYYLSSYNSTTTCESTASRLSTTLTINPIPADPLATSTAICGPGEMTATSGAGGNSVRWYAAATGGSPLQTSTNSPTTSSTTTYYISSYHKINLCESTGPRIATTLTVNPIPSAPTVSSSASCGTGTMVASTGANGNTIRWYAASTGGSPVVTSLTSPSTSATTTYYLSSFNTTTSCESTSPRVAGTLTINSVPLAPSATSTSICGTGTMTAVSGANGNTVKWYSADSGGTALATSLTSPSTSSTTTYHLSSFNSTTNCESTASRVSTTLTIKPIPAAPTVSSTSICGTGTMTATSGSNGNSARWYSVSTGGSPLATSLTSPSTSATTTYYVSSYHTTNLCESTVARVSTTLTIKAVPASPTASNSAICGPGTMTATTGANGNTVRWYSALSGGSPLTTSLTSPTTSTTTTYYLSSYNTTTLCESTAARVPTTLSITAIPQITISGEPTLVYGKQSTLSTGPYYSYQWNVDGNIINGATAQSWVAERAGQITVSVKNSAASPTCISSPTSIATNMASLPAPVNYVSTTRILKDGLTNASSLYTVEPKYISQTIAYQDGLGRTFQAVGVGQSGEQTDLIMPVVYGKQGLVDTTYLPYATNAKDGRFRLHAIRNSLAQYSGSEQFGFYTNATETTIARDSMPYARTMYRQAPDARVKEQGSPGKDWQPGNHTVKNQVFSNSASYPVKYWKEDGTTSGNYPSGTILISLTTDENGNQVRTYTDMQGQTVLKQVETDPGVWLETYYVYDAYGRVKYQVSPKAVSILDATPNLEADVNLAELIYKYVYDSLGRIVESKAPGDTFQYIIYDKLGRIALTQNAHQRALNQWIATKYDYLNRPVYSGLYTNAVQTSRAAVQKLFNNAIGPIHEKPSVNATFHGYTNLVFPANIIPLTINYYDSYDFDRNGSVDYSYNPADYPANVQNSSSLRGLLTGSKKLILNTSNWLISVVFYDRNDRPIQTQSNNHRNLASLVDRVSVLYDFAGHVLETKSTHNGGTTVNIRKRYVYDDTWRTTGIFHTINGGTEQQLVKYEYNSLGQLIDKKLHVSNGGASFLQSVDLRYTIRGWLKSINNSQLGVDANNDDATDYFGMELIYNTSGQATGLGNQASYNGNISAIKWKEMGTGAGSIGQGSYSFIYDNSNRLKGSNFKAHSGTGWNKHIGAFNENMTYDANGNILTLNRSSKDSTGNSLTIDNLSYNYVLGNQLNKVEDTGTSEGFYNGKINGAQEYTYNASGQLTKDENKNISSILYNNLGNVGQVVFTDGKSIGYTYDATGVKLGMSISKGALTTTTDYVGGFVYENNALAFFSSLEGRVVKNGSNYEYQYAIADHQGNTRILFSSATPTPDAPIATLETANESDEAAEFLKYEDVRKINFDIFDHTNTAATKYAVRLSGIPSETYGLARSLAVAPGDKVKAEVFAKYVDPNSTNWTAALNTLMTAIANGTTSPGTIVDGGFYGSSSASTIPFPGALARTNDNGTGPKAYLNWLVFDKTFKLNPVKSGFSRITEIAKENGTDVPHQKLEMTEINIEEAGYIYIYLSNENGTPIDVYFDDFKVTHTPTNIVQYNEYYPYGLQTVNSWSREEGINNNFLYNAGSELNNVTNNYEMFFREYDPALGRMNAVDPMASKYSSLTPYNYSFNDPITFNDPTGADPLYENLYYYNNAMNAGGMRYYQVKDYGTFGGGHITPGSGNHWSDQTWGMLGRAGMRRNITTMSAGTFEKFYNVDLSNPDDQWNVANAVANTTYTMADILSIVRRNGIKNYLENEYKKFNEFKGNNQTVSTNSMAGLDLGDGECPPGMNCQYIGSKMYVYDTTGQLVEEIDLGSDAYAKSIKAYADACVDVAIDIAIAETGGFVLGKLFAYFVRLYLAAPIVNQGSQIILKSGYYEASGFKISEYYYNRLWNNGRGAPFIVAREVLEGSTKGPAHELSGFYNYYARGWHMVYNPTTKEIWHLQPF